MTVNPQVYFVSFFATTKLGLGLAPVQCRRK